MGPGIERIAKEVNSLFPQARTLLLSSDHVTSSAQMKGVLDQITQRQVDILIGTQLIAKGYHFPYLTCIGIVDTDFALTDMDFRASERLFQLLYQVAGRAGRAERRGQVFLQTLQPDVPLFRQVLSYDWDTFVDHEIQRRKAQDCPPITRFTAIILSHRQEHVVQKMADQWQKKCPKHPDIQVFGPAPAPINPLRGMWRWRFLIKAKTGAPVYEFVMHWLNTPPVAKQGLVVEIDRDPYSLL
jgi:primosomal protein N' (replication factor Y)